ncbi:MAG: hypothetical protein QOJ12_1530 [Thermoleophilales bacterium]|nr:hypothetical protein [Thermoleophilales bacterium]
MTPPRAALLLACLIALSLPASAIAKQVSVSSGGVTATLTYSTDAQNYGFKADGLTIVRNGQTLYDAVPAPAICQGYPCGPTVGFGKGLPPLQVRDLDADGEPEVIYSAFTGGAHCCSIAEVFQLSGDAAHYTTVDRNFGDPGFGVQDLNRDGRPEIVTADDAFAYTFSAYAFSGLPLSVLQYDHGSFTDVTSAYPRLLRREARQFWRAYLKLRHNKDDTSRGQVAAWAADQYRLGKRSYARTVLRREVRKGFLGSPGGGAKFIRVLDKFLRAHGY